ncbi:MAG: hypothetical protein ACE5FK_02895 [Candidatus Methylomirabilia bacterium]
MTRRTRNGTTVKLRAFALILTLTLGLLAAPLPGEVVLPFLY